MYRYIITLSTGIIKGTAQTPIQEAECKSTDRYIMVQFLSLLQHFFLIIKIKNEMELRGGWVVFMVFLLRPTPSLPSKKVNKDHCLKIEPQHRHMFYIIIKCIHVSYILNSCLSRHQTLDTIVDFCTILTYKVQYTRIVSS